MATLAKLATILALRLSVGFSHALAVFSESKFGRHRAREGGRFTLFSSRFPLPRPLRALLRPRMSSGDISVGADVIFEAPYFAPRFTCARPLYRNYSLHELTADSESIPFRRPRRSDSISQCTQRQRPSIACSCVPLGAADSRAYAPRFFLPRRLRALLRPYQLV